MKNKDQSNHSVSLFFACSTIDKAFHTKNDSI